MVQFEAACAPGGPLITDYIRDGGVTDQSLFKTLGITGPSGDCDGKSMKSQRFVQLTHPTVQAATLARLAAEKDKKHQAAERKEGRAERKNIKAHNLIVNKGAYVGRRQKVTLTVMNSLRALSQAVQDPAANDTKCMSCSVLFSILQTKPEHKTGMWWCPKCDNFQCSLCCAEKDFNAKHVTHCSEVDMELEEQIRDADAEAEDAMEGEE